jgi:hypothetical protein
MPTRSAAHIQHALSHLQVTKGKEAGDVHRFLVLFANRSHLPDIPLRIAELIDVGPVGLPGLCWHACTFLLALLVLGGCQSKGGSEGLRR